MSLRITPESAPTSDDWINFAECAEQAGYLRGLREAEEIAGKMAKSAYLIRGGVDAATIIRDEIRALIDATKEK